MAASGIRLQPSFDASLVGTVHSPHELCEQNSIKELPFVKRCADFLAFVQAPHTRFSTGLPIAFNIFSRLPRTGLGPDMSSRM